MNNKSAYNYVGAKRLVFHLSPRDVHVIIVSGCLTLTTVNLIILIRMAYITDRLEQDLFCHLTSAYMKCVRVGGRTQRHNQIFSDG